MKKCWSPGAAGHPDRHRRQIELCNQLGLFGAIATLPYQLFYFLYDLAPYWGVFTANVLFMVGYLSALPLNYAKRYATAKKAVLLNGCLHVFVATLFIGAESGVHLFYFSLAAIMVFLFKQLHMGSYMVLLSLFGGLYIIAHFLFSPARAITPVPSPWVDMMYAVSVVCVLMLLGGLLYLSRQQIDMAEDQLTHKNAVLETLSNTDPLTGLANRRVLDITLEREWARLMRQTGALSVIMCDVDHFKRYNDHYGHDEGDECLKKVAAALERTLARPTNLVARYGGEEFAFVLPGTDEQGARHLGDKLCKAIRELRLPHAGASTGTVTISVGVSSITPSRYEEASLQSGKQLLKCADQALYQAKTHGRNRVEFIAFLE